MTEIPIVVSDDVVTVGGYTDKVELQLSVGATGERGSRIFTGSVNPNTLPSNDPIWGGYTDFKSGDIYLQRDTDLLAVWEWLYTSGEYTWVRTVEDIAGSGGSVTLDPDLNAIANLSGTGILRRTGVNAWALDTAAYLTSNQTVTLSGDVSGSGTTSIITTVADDSHSHTGATISALDAGDTTTGTFNIARIPTGTTGTTVALGSHTHNYVGLVSSTDNTVARFDGTGGALQGSGVTIDDSGNVGGVAGLNVSKAAYAGVQVSSNEGTGPYIQLATAGVGRWDFFRNDETESGSGAGSNLQINRLSDAGGLAGTPIKINRATGRVTLGDVGSTAGLEFGSSGPRMMMGTGTPSGVSAPAGSVWRQTDANSTYGNLTGLLWNKVGTGTTLGTDWLVDFEGRWIDWTPTWTNVSMSSTTAKYTRTGKLATFYCVGTLSSAPSGAVFVTMPVDMTNDPAPHGPVRLLRSGSWQGVWFYSAATHALVRYLDDANTWQNLSSTLPASWASGDKIALNGTYEIA